MSNFKLSISELEYILENAKSMKETDTAFSDTIEFVIKASTDLHTGNDQGYAALKYDRPECGSKAITSFGY